MTPMSAFTTAPCPTRATWSATAAIRRMRNGRAAPASRCSSCSTTRKAARTACCTATPAPSSSCPRCSIPPSYPERHMSMEGIYEYGSRAGVWRILREFEKRGLPLTVFGVGMALQRYPELAAAFKELGHEIACHGWRWIHYQDIDEATEREHMRMRHGDHRASSPASAPLGWYTGRDSPQHAPPGGRLRRLRVRQRLLRRRPAVLDEGAQERRQRGAAPGRALHAGLQRHALRAAAGLRAGRRLLHLPARQLRRALRRGRRRRPRC